jgi:hypothetical protein
MTNVVGVPAEYIAPMRSEPFWPAFEAVAHTLAYDGAIMGDYSLPDGRVASVTLPHS